MDLTASNAGAGMLTDQELHDMVAAALARLKADGVSPDLLARLAHARYEVGSLADGLLGYTYAADRTVVLSPNAAGYGWFAGGTADDLMATFLAPGVRRTDALDAVFRGG
jgi:hypothetical protein